MGLRTPEWRTDYRTVIRILGNALGCSRPCIDQLAAPRKGFGPLRMFVLTHRRPVISLELL
jgi:hypothetical protein